MTPLLKPLRCNEEVRETSGNTTNKGVIALVDRRDLSRRETPCLRVVDLDNDQFESATDMEMKLTPNAKPAPVGE
jgi:hypothetical protein